MPRQRTKGDSLAFRLPVHLDDVFQGIARKMDKRPRDLAADIIADWVIEHAHDHASPASAGRQDTSHSAAGLVNEFFGEH